MRTVSDNYINYISSSLVRRPRSRFVVDNVIYSGERYLVSYPKVEHKTDKAVGSFPAKTCELEILNIDGTLDLHGKEVTVYRGLEIDGETEWVRIGVFMASDDNIKTNINKRTITFKGTDKTQKLDKPYGGRAQWDKSRRVLHIVRDICERNSIELSTSLFPMNDYVFPDIPPGLDFDNVTERQVISYIAELSGSIAIFSHNGKLAIIGETDTGVTIPKTKYKSLSVENSVGPINAISFGHADYDDALLYMQAGVTDDTKSEWAINDNPLTTTTDRNNLIQQISGYFFGRSFTPFELDGIIDDYIFDLNDTVTIEKKDGSTVNVTLLETANTSRIKSRFGASLQTPGKTKTALSGSVKERIGKVELLVDHQNQTIQAIAQDGENIKTVLELTLDAVSAQSEKIETLENAGYITEAQAQGLIEASSENVALSVSKKLQIGTRNILLNSACFEKFTLSSSKATPYYSVLTYELMTADNSYPSGKAKTLAVTPTSDKPKFFGVRYKNENILGETSVSKIKPNQPYTLSFWLSDDALSGGETRKLSKTGLISAGDGATVRFTDDSEIVLTDKPQRFTVTFTITGTISRFWLLFARERQEGDLASILMLSSLKLEEGNVATDWTPNSQELTDAVQSVEAKLELCVQTDENGILKSAIHAKANQITIESDNFTLDGEGNMSCTNATITGGTIQIGKDDTFLSIKDGILELEQNDFRIFKIDSSVFKTPGEYGGEDLTICAELIVPGGVIFSSDSGEIASFRDDGFVKFPGTLLVENGVCEPLKILSADGKSTRFDIERKGWKLGSETSYINRDTINSSGGFVISANNGYNALSFVANGAYFYTSATFNGNLCIPYFKNAPSAGSSNGISYAYIGVDVATGNLIVIGG